MAYEWSSQRLDPIADRLNFDLQALFDAKVAEGNQLADEATATFHHARRLALILLALAFLIGVPALRVHHPRHAQSTGAIVTRLGSLRATASRSCATG